MRVWGGRAVMAGELVVAGGYRPSRSRCHSDWNVLVQQERGDGGGGDGNYENVGGPSVSVGPPERRPPLAPP